MTSFAFRIRLHDPLTDEDADRLYEAFDEEVAIEEGPKGHFVGFEREAASFLDAALDAVTKVIDLGFHAFDEFFKMVEEGHFFLDCSLLQELGKPGRRHGSSAVPTKSLNGSLLHL